MAEHLQLANEVPPYIGRQLWGFLNQLLQSDCYVSYDANRANSEWLACT